MSAYLYVWGKKDKDSKEVVWLTLIKLGPVDLS